MTQDERNTLRRLRRLATSKGLRLVRPYSRAPHKIDGYTLVKPTGKLSRPGGSETLRPVLGKRFDASLADVARYLGAALALLLCLTVPVSAQVMDPDPSEPNAQQVAEARYQMSCVGLMAPPVGWNCVQALPDDYGPTAVYCEPDALLVEQQEREREAWEEYRRLLWDAVRRHRGRR